MTTTVSEPLLLQREGIREGITRGFEAAAAARSARKAADEASRWAGALADQRAAADSAVRESRRRLNAVQGLRPTRLGLAVRGVLGAQRAARLAAYGAALTDQAAVVAKVRGYLEEAAACRARADQATERAAMLPRLLDEAALLVRAVGGDGAARLVASEAAIVPILAEDARLSAQVRAARHGQERLRAALDRLAAADACATDQCPQARSEVEASREAVGEALAELGQQTELGELLTLGESVPNPERARSVLSALAAVCSDLELRRADARHRLAQARADRTAILRGL